MKTALLGISESLAQFWDAFPNEATCAAYLVRLRWPSGFACPRCGCSEAILLECRAYTFQCHQCRRQTSIIAETLMQDSKLPLKVWFGAAHLISTYFDALPIQQFQELLGIKYYKTAWTLWQKLRPLMNISNSVDIEVQEGLEPLDGVVDVTWAEISRASALTSSADTRFLIAGAIEVRQGNAKDGSPKPRIRLATITDDGAGAIEVFVRANVKVGASLLTDSHKSYRGLTEYRLHPRGVRTTPGQVFIRSIAYRLSRANELDRESVDRVLNKITQTSRTAAQRHSFETVLILALRHEPTSYWDIIDRDNPRRGKLTTRRQPRRRKTANGMRQDGSGRQMKLTPDR